jgi:NAD(P)H-hydrate epimerase
MNFVTRDMMREMDRRAIAEFGVPGRVLMDRAGHGVARAAWALLGDVPNGRRTVTVVAGRGNNGGDGFVAARYLAAWGARVSVLAAAGSDSFSGDALYHLGKMIAAGISPSFLPAAEDWSGPLESPKDADLFIDAVLGTGSSGAPRGAPAAAIGYLARAARNSLVLAVDVPSGMNADTGTADGGVVPADLTVTFGFPKTGMSNPDSWSLTGAVLVEDIGIPREIAKDVRSMPGAIDPSDFRSAFRRRPRQAHKGDFGRVCIVAGAAGYSGAAAMAAMAALRSGAGLVSVLTSRSAAPLVAAAFPEAMVHAVEETDTGSLTLSGVESASRLLLDSDVVLAGPGMTPHAETRKIVEMLLGLQNGRTLILDADALNVLAGNPGLLRKRERRVIVTPHPGELARLSGLKTADIQADRLKAAQTAAEAAGCVVILKGAGTVVAAPGATPRINLTGNPGMATGGSGDVLAGTVAGLCAQTTDILAAAEAATWSHGFSGDRAAWKKSQAGLIATDIVAVLPEVLRMFMDR